MSLLKELLVALFIAVIRSVWEESAYFIIQLEVTVCHDREDMVAGA